MKRTRLPLAPDHIFAADAITKIKGYDKLARAQQLELLTELRNIQGLPYRLNSSKGARTALTWKSALGKDIDPGYTKWLRRRELTLKKHFETRINTMLNGG